MENLIIPSILNILSYNNVYNSLYNCIFITICSFLKLTFLQNELINKLFIISFLNSSLYYIIDTFKILKNNKIDIFVIHHICSSYIILSNYIFDYQIYSSYLILFLIELSSVSYNLYYHRFIKKQTHKIIYVPLRIICNVLLIYFILYDIKYTYLIELFLYLISYGLLLLFNTGGILKSLNLI
jgi:hypothetical protein